MAEDHKANIAEYLRTKYTLPVEATDDDVIAYARQEAPDEIGAVEKAAYTNSVDRTPEEPQSLAGRAVARLDRAGSAINQGVENFSNLDIGEEFKNNKDPVESFAIASAKGLKKVTEIGKLIGSKFDSASTQVGDISNVLGKLDPGAKRVFDQATRPVSQVLEQGSELSPRTPMQTAFALLTLPFTEIEGIGNGIVNAGKRLASGVSSVAEKSVMGALRSPATRYPESKLAQRLEKLFSGSEGEGTFNIINKSSENAERQAIGKAHIADAEIAHGAAEEGQIVEKLSEDVSGIRHEQDKFLKAAELKKNAAVTDLSASLAENKEKKAALDAAEAANAENLKKAQESKKAQAASIQADLSVNKALNLLDKDSQGIYVGKELGRAKFEADTAVNMAYDKTMALGELVTADTRGLNESFGEMRAELVEKLKVNSEDTRAQKILGILEEGTTPPSMSKEVTNQLKSGADFIEHLKGKDVKLSDLMQLYSDLNELHREKHDRIYKQAKKLVMQHLRKYEDIPWNRAVIDSWDAARQAKIHVSMAFENKTIEPLLKMAWEGKPAALFNALVETPQSTMPLQNFMRIAPEEAKQVVRRESLSRGFSIVDSVDGKSVDNLNNWVNKIGEGNIDILHKGQDINALTALAESNDAIYSANKVSPGIKADINKIIEQNGELARDYAKKIDRINTVVSKNKESVFNKTRALHDAARQDIVARREKTVELIDRNLKDLESAFQIQAKVGERAADAGKMFVKKDRKGDVAADVAIGAGAATLVASGAAEMAGINVSKYIKGGAAMAVAAGLAKKSPRVMSNIYYSPVGRKIMERIASAPTTKEAALALLDLATALKNPGLYLTVKPVMKDKPALEGPKMPGLGKLEALRGRNAQEASMLNTPNEPPDEIKPNDDVELGTSENPGVIPQEL